MADTKKEYTSNLHPKGDLDTTVYPNVKSENIIDKDLTSYNAGRVPDSSLVSKSLDGISENLETTKIEVGANKTNIATLQGDVAGLKQDNTQNKKDIANLKANYTEVQSQANKNSSDIALTKTEVSKKQNTLHRHTIEITKDNEATLILTTESTISTEINTMDKFISAFKGSELACMCSLYDNNGWNIHFIGIQVGTTLDGTSMMSTNLLDTSLTFVDVFGTSGYTMIDKVKPL